MMAAYRHVAGRRFGAFSPAFVTRPGAWVLGTDPALALTGRRVVPTRLLDEGFEFTTPHLGDAIATAS